MPGVHDTGQPLDSSLSWHDKSDAGAGLAVPVFGSLQAEGRLRGERALEAVKPV